MAHLIDPSLVSLVRAAVRVELAGTWTRGATVVDLDGVTGLPPNADVGMEVDAAGFWDLIVEAVRVLGSARPTP